MMLGISQFGRLYKLILLKLSKSCDQRIRRTACVSRGNEIGWQSVNRRGVGMNRRKRMMKLRIETYKYSNILLFTVCISFQIISEVDLSVLITMCVIWFLVNN